MENKYLEKQFESKEDEPKSPDLKVDFIRHGKPSYTNEEIESGEAEGNLTPEGARQIKERAVELALKIDKDKELVVFWVSPKQRAEQSAKIIFDTFEEQGLAIIKEPKTVESLGDVKMSPDFIAELMENNAMGKWMEYWTESDLPAGTEKPEEVKGRTERVITYLERIARKVTPVENKKLHFICIGHEETFRDLLEEGYGIGTKENTGPGYGEVLSMDINRTKDDKNAKIKLNYEGQTIELEFDKKNRKFFKPETTQ